MSANKKSPVQFRMESVANKEMVFHTEGKKSRNIRTSIQPYRCKSVWLDRIKKSDSRPASSGSQLAYSPSCELHESYRSKSYNKQDDHFWARTELVSQRHIPRKLPCASREERARDAHHCRFPHDAVRGSLDNGQANSSNLFAGKTLVRRR